MITGEPERHTQNRIIKLFKEQLGYTYLGNWEERTNNQNVEESLLEKFLKEQNYPQNIINRAIYLFHTEASSSVEV
jgi:type I restriction enzyme, R subunit